MEGKNKQGRGEEGKLATDTKAQNQDSDWGNFGNIFDAGQSNKGKPQSKRNTVKKQSEKVSWFTVFLVAPKIFQAPIYGFISFSKFSTPL